MKHNGVGQALAWMFTGAAVVAAGAFVGTAAGRRRERRPSHGGRPEPELPDDLADRPVARAAWDDVLAATRQVDRLVHTVTGLESRVAAIETTTGQVDQVWQRVVRLEQQLDELRRERLESADVEAVAAQAAERILPRVAGLESRVERHDAAIQQLQSHAVQTDANLQRMIAAVEKLTEQISRVLPATTLRIEPKRETAAAGQEATPAEEKPGEERSGLSRWRSVALIGAVALGLVGSYAAGRQVDWPQKVTAATLAPAPPSQASLLETAITALGAVAEKDPENIGWKYELGRLNELQRNWVEAERWYRAVLEVDPHDPRAVNALADVLAAKGPS